MTTRLDELSTRLNSISTHTESKPCPYARMVDSFMKSDEAVGKLLGSIIYDPTVPMRKIYIEIKRFGYRISHESLSLHRHGDCTCPEEEKA